MLMNDYKKDDDKKNNKEKKNYYVEDKIKYYFYKNDIPSDSMKDIKNTEIVAIDTEAMGLDHNRDRLCTIQMCFDDNLVFVVHFIEKKYNFYNLLKILKNKKILKLFHYARFDVTMIYKYLGVLLENIVCTRVLSKIARTYNKVLKLC